MDDLTGEEVVVAFRAVARLADPEVAGFDGPRRLLDDGFRPADGSVEFAIHLMDAYIDHLVASPSNNPAEIAVATSARARLLRQAVAGRGRRGRLRVIQGSRGDQGVADNQR